MNVFIKIILWIHQLPQNIVGFILSLGKKEVREYTCGNGDVVKVYFTNNCFGCGVSLGNYIILDTKYLKFTQEFVEQTASHEHGHQIQSLYFGWLYLIVIGFASAICNNLWDRIFHKSWTQEETDEWYYNRYPERWADKLGGVVRPWDNK